MSKIGLKQARAAHHHRDPVTTTFPPDLRACPATSKVAAFKRNKYKALELAGRRQCENGDRLGGLPQFVPLVVSTLGQFHGLRPISTTLCAAYRRKLEAEGPRHDDSTPAELVTAFKRALRTSLLVAVARGQAQAMLATGTLFTSLGRGPRVC